MPGDAESADHADAKDGEKMPDVTNRRDVQAFAIIGAAMEVHRQLGHGFLEQVYWEALGLELRLRSIPFEREVPLTIHYKGTALQCAYRADYICYGEVLVELKALDRLGTSEQAQIINYLKATGLKRGLLINFGAPRLDYRRMVLGHTDLWDDPQMTQKSQIHRIICVNLRNLRMIHDPEWREEGVRLGLGARAVGARAGSVRRDEPVRPILTASWEAR